MQAPFPEEGGKDSGDWTCAPVLPIPLNFPMLRLDAGLLKENFRVEKDRVSGKRFPNTRCACKPNQGFTGFRDQVVPQISAAHGTDTKFYNSDSVTWNPKSQVSERDMSVILGSARRWVDGGLGACDSGR